MSPAAAIDASPDASIPLRRIIAPTLSPRATQHPDDDVFYVLEGTMSIFVGDRWVDAKKGSFVLAPGGMEHDFENRSSKRAGMLNISVPGNFEGHMPGTPSGS